MTEMAEVGNYTGDSNLIENSVIGEPDLNFWLNHRKTYGVVDGTRVESSMSMADSIVVSSELIEPIDRSALFFDRAPLTHRPIIDIDSPMRLIESSTPGHYHLYIERAMCAEDMWKLLDVMAEIGLVEHGYVEASKSRGATHVRLPWVKKKEKNREGEF